MLRTCIRLLVGHSLQGNSSSQASLIDKVLDLRPSSLEIPRFGLFRVSFVDLALLAIIDN